MPRPHLAELGKKVEASKAQEALLVAQLMEAKNQLEATLSKQDLSHAQANVDDSELGV